MKVTERTKYALKCRREERDLTKAGYRRHETDWEIHRGDWCGLVITDAKVSACGRYVYTRVGMPQMKPTDRGCV